MKNYSVITILPTVIEAYKEFGVLRAAQANLAADINTINLRDYSLDKHGTVDAAPYGGGDGMVLRPEPLAEAVKAVHGNPIVICPSPGGEVWTQSHAKSYAQEERPLVFVCGRFGGMDQRFIDEFVQQEYSMGDFVVSGGELPALMMMDSILRFVPNVLGHNESAEKDSFGDVFGGGLEYPLYTRPEDFEGKKVPEVLLSGNHKKIQEWRDKESEIRTQKARPDLLK